MKTDFSDCVTMKKKRDGMFLAVFDGGDGLTYGTWREVMDDVQLHVSEQIALFYRDALPIKVTEEVKKWLDVKVFKLDNEVQDVPFQQWLDDWYTEMKEEDEMKEKREREELKRLLEKYGKP